MKKTFFKMFVIFVLALALTSGAFALVGCHKKTADVDYSTDNDFEVETKEYVFNPNDEEEYRFGAVVYSPQGAIAKYGFVFFVGSFIASEYYDYLATALAQQGYVVAIPNVMANSAYTYYEENTKVATEKVFDMFKDVKFFVGGHSQGGGAAMRFAEEEESHILGAVFFAPLCYTTNKQNPNYDPYDPESKPWEYDEDGNVIVVRDTLENSTLPTLLLEASNDHVLTAAQKQDALERMSKNCTRFVLQKASHMGFSTLKLSLAGDGEDITDEDLATQRGLTIERTLAFLRSVVGKN